MEVTKWLKPSESVSRIRFRLGYGSILGGWTRSPLSGLMRSAVTFEALAHLRNQIFIAYKLCVPLL